MTSCTGEGEEVIVKDILGREARLRVTAETKIEGVPGRLKTGDKILAQIAPDGRALSITLQIPDSGPLPLAYAELGETSTQPFTESIG